jgi:hypothetical protein
MLHAFVNFARTVFLVLTSAQWCYKNAFMMVNYSKEKKYIQSAQQIFTTLIYIGCLIVNYKTKRRSDTGRAHRGWEMGGFFYKFLCLSL